MKISYPQQEQNSNRAQSQGSVVHPYLVELGKHCYYGGCETGSAATGQSQQTLELGHANNDSGGRGKANRHRQRDQVHQSTQSQEGHQTLDDTREEAQQNGQMRS